MKKKLLFTILIMIITCMSFSNIANASSGDLYLNKLEFNAKINSDGNMNVTEIWDIDIEDTNTLFKTFKTDKTKYSAITNVQVTDMTNGLNKKFTKINQYMYHVTKDCYYGLMNSDGDFEIAWGVGLENKEATKKYKMEYTVEDVITKYNDYAELYWQFVGQDFEISANKVTGTITLPGNVNSKDEIKVWGHTKDLNGTIYATDLNKIEFELDKARSGRYIEIRTLFPSNLIGTTTQRIKNTSILEKAIQEETKWADEANRKRELQAKTKNAILIIAGIGSIVIAIFYIGKVKKYRKILKNLNPYKPTNKLEYYRDLPDEKATPGEAVFLLKGLYSDFTMDFGKIFSATILDLTLKQYISLSVDSNLRGKEAIKITDLKKEGMDLKTDEKEMLEFLKKAMKSKEEITMKELETYIKAHSSAIEKLIPKVHKNVKSNLITNQYFDEEEYKQYNNYLGKFVLYLVGAICLFFLLPLAIVFMLNAVYCYKIKNRMNVLTQEGLDQKEMWKGLKKYMEDFSLLKEREVPELVIWEKYLVYATAFGISEKVLKQLKIVYPTIDQTDMLNTSTYMYFMYHSNFNTDFSSAITSSIASATYSSGSGSGGGFSGGGGFGGRWPEVAEVDKYFRLQKILYKLCIVFFYIIGK